MFGVDVDAVPGKCPNPTTVSPGATPQSPTQQDLAVRDRLIADQEALLNMYRCGFDVDTQLVPGGCATQTGPRPIGQPAGAFTAISAGWRYSCGIRADGTAVCWGHKEWAKADAPSGQFTAISAGAAHSCGIRTDRTAVCWGSHYMGAPAGQFTAISAGVEHSCGIRTDGTAVCWGWNNSDNFGQMYAPSGQFTAISAGVCRAPLPSRRCWVARRAGLFVIPTFLVWPSQPRIEYP